jgi:polyhydroxybutyrate depolymerase
MACDHADLVAGIVSVAGAMWVDPKRCAPSGAVSVLEIHGTADAVIAYDGGVFHAGFPPYPGATTSVADWARFDGCATPGDASLAPLDLDRALPGAETSVTRYATGCRGASSVELWTVRGAGHSPTLSGAVAGKVLDFLLAHPKP